MLSYLLDEFKNELAGGGGFGEYIRSLDDSAIVTIMCGL